MHTERATPLIIVGAAIIADGRLLGCERAEPPEAAGKWEFPGGKVEPGESDLDALVRECEEELGVIIAAKDRIGGDVPLAHGWAMLRVWLAEIVRGEPQAIEHASLRWLAPGRVRLGAVAAGRRPHRGRGRQSSSATPDGPRYR